MSHGPHGNDLAAKPGVPAQRYGQLFFGRLWPSLAGFARHDVGKGRDFAGLRDDPGVPGGPGGERMKLAGGVGLGGDE
jgi:hypothetical protein